MPCFLAGPKGSGLDKRQASLQLCIRADGEQLVRLAIIFRGTGKRVTEEEALLYRRLSRLIRVYWQVNNHLTGLLNSKLYNCLCVPVLSWLYFILALFSRMHGLTKLSCWLGLTNLSQICLPWEEKKFYLEWTITAPNKPRHSSRSYSK
jgi:hypothetical protein